jgi:hypothetical protein
MVQVCLCRAVALGDKPLRRTIGYETLDLWLLWIEFVLGRERGLIMGGRVVALTRVCGI